MLAAFLLAMVAQEPGSSREERVLELLRVLEHDEGSWRYVQATFDTFPREGEEPQLAASYFLFCGNSNEGTIDGPRTRLLALEVCRIYGLDVQADQAWSDRHGMARLDGLDVRRKLGFELRGHGTKEFLAEPVPEVDAHALDDAELARLRATGHRLYIADIQGYSNDEDVFTPTLAYLAGLVGFLNDVTEGEDVDLRGLLCEREASWVWKLELAEGMRMEEGQYGPELVVERAGIARVPCAGASDFRPLHTEPLYTGRPGPEFPASTRGAPSVVIVKSAAKALAPNGPRPGFLVRYRQRSGAAELVHETRSFVAFLPRAFDLAQPFELELDLTPGRYSFYGGHARIGAAAPRR